MRHEWLMPVRAEVPSAVRSLSLGLMKTAVIARETQAACGRDLRRKDHERQHYGSGRLASGNGHNEDAGRALRRAGWDDGLRQVVNWSAPRAPPGDPLQRCRRGD